jgi:hypothetical protein
VGSLRVSEPTAERIRVDSVEDLSGVPVEMGVEARCEGVHSSIERIEARVHPTDERVEPDIDVIQASIDAVELSISPRGKRVDPRTEIEERAERHSSKDRQRGPDHSVHLVGERSTRQ